VPIPSDVAKFIGQILSNIISIMREIPNPGNGPRLLPLTLGEPPPLDFPWERTPLFFVGEAIDFLPVVPFDDEPVDFVGEAVPAASLNVEPRDLNLFFYS
jgi:hypothetical protein